MGHFIKFCFLFYAPLQKKLIFFRNFMQYLDRHEFAFSWTTNDDNAITIATEIYNIARYCHYLAFESWMLS